MGTVTIDRTSVEVPRVEELAYDALKDVLDELYNVLVEYADELDDYTYETTLYWRNFSNFGNKIAVKVGGVWTIPDFRLPTRVPAYKYTMSIPYLDFDITLPYFAMTIPEILWGKVKNVRICSQDLYYYNNGSWVLGSTLGKYYSLTDVLKDITGYSIVFLILYGLTQVGFEKISKYLTGAITKVGNFKETTTLKVLKDTATTSDGKIDSIKAETDKISSVKLQTDKITDVKSETDKITSIKTNTDLIDDIKTATDLIDDVKTETDKLTAIKTNTDLIDDIKTETDKITSVKANTDLIDDIKEDTDKIDAIKTNTDLIDEVKTNTDLIDDIKLETDKITSIQTETNKIPSMKLSTDMIDAIKTEILKLDPGLAEIMNAISPENSNYLELIYNEVKAIYKGGYR